jgi:hypothetical protein
VAKNDRLKLTRPDIGEKTGEGLFVFENVVIDLAAVGNCPVFGLQISAIYSLCGKTEI